MRGWLKLAKTMSIRTALRKGDLRTDMRIRAPGKMEVYSDEQLYVMMQGFLTVATVRGLDVVGIVSDWLRPGQIAQMVVQQKNIDIFVIPGTETVTAEGIGVLSFNTQQEVEHRLPLDDCLKRIKELGGFAIIIQPSKRWSQRINKLLEQEWAPAGIEAWCETLSREYFDEDIAPEYQIFITSGAENPNQLEDTNLNTRVGRKWFEDNGIMAPETGKEFEPEYLKQFEGNQYGI